MATDYRDQVIDPTTYNGKLYVYHAPNYWKLRVGEHHTLCIYRNHFSNHMDECDVLVYQQGEGSQPMTERRFTELALGLAKAYVFQNVRERLLGLADDEPLAPSKDQRKPMPIQAKRGCCCLQ